MPTNYSHPPVISCYLVLYDPHEVEVDLSLLVLVHPRLQYRSAERSHVSTASQQISDSDLSPFTSSTKKKMFRILAHARWEGGMSADQREKDQLAALHFNEQIKKYGS
jgi:hypothetical protein